MDTDHQPVRNDADPGPGPDEQPVSHVDVRTYADHGPVLIPVYPRDLAYADALRADYHHADGLGTFRDCRADAGPDTLPDDAGEHGDIDALRIAYASACRGCDRGAIAALSRRIAVHPDRCRPRGLTD